MKTLTNISEKNIFLWFINWLRVTRKVLLHPVMVKFCFVNSWFSRLKRTRSVKSCFFVYHFQQLTEQDLIKLDWMIVVKNSKKRIISKWFDGISDTLSLLIKIHSRWWFSGHLLIIYFSSIIICWQKVIINGWLLL